MNGLRRRLLLATGAFHVPPDIPGVQPCLGHSMFFCKDCDGHRVRGKRIAIIGANNEAVEYALGMLHYSSCVVVATNGKRPHWDRQHARWLEEYEIPVARKRIRDVAHRKRKIRALEFATAGSMRIVEAPWYYEWALIPYPVYQRIHRQRVVIGFVRDEPFPVGEARPFDPRFRLHNSIHLRDMDSLCALKVNRVVIHKDLEAELGRSLDRNFVQELPGLMSEYHRAYGPPVFEDGSLIVFDTDKVCLVRR